MKKTLFDKMEDLEFLLSKLYARFSDLFEENAEIKKFFSKLSEEELSHRDIIHLQKRLVGKNMALIGDVDCDLKTVDSIVNKITKIFQSNRDFTLHEALFLAVEFEIEAAEYHLRNAVTFSNPNISKMMTSLGKSDDSHRQAIINMAKKQGVLIELSEDVETDGKYSTSTKTAIKGKKAK